MFKRFYTSCRLWLV